MRIEHPAFFHGFIAFFLIASLTVLFAFSDAIAPAKARAADSSSKEDPTPPDDISVFAIGNLDSLFDFPLLRYSIDLTDITLEATTHLPNRALGPISLAVEESISKVYVGFESTNILDVVDATTFVPEGMIEAVGTVDLAGMVVHPAKQQLFVVDRNEQTVFVYSTLTFDSVEQWTLPTGNGAWGIDLMNDYLFVGDASATVRYYDITSHAEVDNVTLSIPAVAVAVTDYPEPTLFASGHSGVSGLTPYLSKYYLDSGIEEVLEVGDDPKGIALNPAAGLVYITEGNRILVIDIETMVIEQVITLGATWVPTDLVSTTLEIGEIIDDDDDDTVDDDDDDDNDDDDTTDDDDDDDDDNDDDDNDAADDDDIDGDDDDDAAQKSDDDDADDSSCGN